MSEEIVESIKRNKVLLVNLFMYVNPISIDEKMQILRDINSL